tara:strand:- start:4094 stop:5095 length:1002 start_codon:yes stop_codon:yes gene_type:complete
MDTKRFNIEQNMLRHFDVNLVTNGTFDTDSDWSTGTGVTINTTSKKAVFTDAANAQGIQQGGILTAGKNYSVTFTVSNITEGGVKVRYPETNQTATTNGTFTFTGVSTGTAVRFQADGETSAEIDNVKVQEYGTSGFVTTLYDQTGNNCHALQVTAAHQPQIVSGGDLIKSGNHPAWEHTDQSNLELHGKIQAAHLDAWFVHDTSDDTFLYPSNGSDYGGDFGWVAQTHTSVSGTGDYGGSDAKLYVNGTLIGASGTMNRTVIKTALTGRKLAHHQDSDTADWQSLQMGLYDVYGNGYCYQGKFSEWIWYDSDQSGNKTGIESNINSHYNIYS